MLTAAVERFRPSAASLKLRRAATAANTRSAASGRRACAFACTTFSPAGLLRTLPGRVLVRVDAMDAFWHGGASARLAGASVLLNRDSGAANAARPATPETPQPSAEPMVGRRRMH